MNRQWAISTAKKLRVLACGNLKKDADRLIEYLEAKKP